MITHTGRARFEYKGKSMFHKVCLKTYKPYLRASITSRAHLIRRD